MAAAKAAAEKELEEEEAVQCSICIEIAADRLHRVNRGSYS